MRLKVINSNSAGNCYLLESESGEVLMIECGVRWEVIKRALNFDLSSVAGCLVTHSHGDHCKAVTEVLEVGISVYATKGEHEAMCTINHHNAEVIKARSLFTVGAFEIIPFEIKHDTPEPVGFLIRQEEMGTCLFLTDTVYSPYTFTGLNNLIVEANYCEDILQANLAAGANKYVGDRVIQSHLSLQNCKDLLLANDLTAVNNIVLIHLSNGNSDAVRFGSEVRQLTGKTVHVADKGMIIPFGKTPF